jgi:hypothetical protein
MDYGVLPTLEPTVGTEPYRPRASTDLAPELKSPPGDAHNVAGLPRHLTGGQLLRHVRRRSPASRPIRTSARTRVRSPRGSWVNEREAAKPG